MDFRYSQKVTALQEKLSAFMAAHIYPNERRHAEEIAAGDRWQPLALLEELKAKARGAGLWNLFLPELRAWRRARQSRIRAALRDHGPLGLGRRSL